MRRCALSAATVGRSTTLGDAYRNPKDASQPMIGEEIAAARGLIALGAELLQHASSRIEQTTHQPAHIYR